MKLAKQLSLVVFPYLVPQKRSKTDKKKLIRFFSVRLYNLQLIDGMLFQFLALLLMFFIMSPCNREMKI